MDWFALMTKALQEQLARDDLRRRGFEVFWPYTSHWVGTGHKSKSRLVKRSWLSRYLFVQTSRERLTEVQDERARNMGVATVVRATNNEPYPIPDEAINLLMDKTDHLGEVYLGNVPKRGPQFSVGDVVRVTDEKHPLFGFLAEIKRVLDNNEIVANMFTHSLLGSSEFILTSSGGIEVVAGRHTKEAVATAKRA